MTISSHPRPLRLHASSDFGDSTQTQHALWAGQQHQVAQRLQAAQSFIGHHQHQSIAVFEFAHRSLRIVVQQSLTQGLDALTHSRDTLWIKRHLIFARLPAQHLDLGHIGQGCQHRTQLEHREIAQAYQIATV